RSHVHQPSVTPLTRQHVDQSANTSLYRPVQYAAVRVTIVVPCYNEEKRLDTKAFLDFRFEGHDLEFLFANDGSRDGTLHVIDTMRAIFAKPFLSRWIFDVEIIARFIKLRGRDAAVNAIYELPIRTWHDVAGSKVKSRDFIRALADLWKIHRAYRIR